MRTVTLHAVLNVLEQVWKKGGVDHYVTLQSVAEDAYLSISYVESIAGYLGDLHVLKGKRGRSGGCKFARSLKDITIHEIALGISELGNKALPRNLKILYSFLNGVSLEDYFQNCL
ncbi:MAG: hypothetical protein EOM19_06035 [Candidatus Moranbacteria bacterium]|nr:hypothetical protein [Candidatus Moranbacteria bacterium]